MTERPKARASEEHLEAWKAWQPGSAAANGLTDASWQLLQHRYLKEQIMNGMSEALPPTVAVVSACGMIAYIHYPSCMCHPRGVAPHRQGKNR